MFSNRILRNSTNIVLPTTLVPSIINNGSPIRVQARHVLSCLGRLIPYITLRNFPNQALELPYFWPFPVNLTEHATYWGLFLTTCRSSGAWSGPESGNCQQGPDRERSGASESLTSSHSGGVQLRRKINHDMRFLCRHNVCHAPQSLPWSNVDVNIRRRRDDGDDGDDGDEEYDNMFRYCDDGNFHVSMYDSRYDDRYDSKRVAHEILKQ
ncbi:hypothetical protein F5B19DRAFT_463645 [Rostrohypoxylon terebratum]|nr:hypothetical protein F5B19DRAFT_463645 [Rostrohypoxylon terebratum]